mgnify:FL=1
MLFLYGTIFGVLVSSLVYFFRKRITKNYQSRNSFLRVTIQDSFLYLEERLAHSNTVKKTKYCSKEILLKYLQQTYAPNTFLEVKFSGSGEKKEISISSFYEED